MEIMIKEFLKNVLIYHVNTNKEYMNFTLTFHSFSTRDNLCVFIVTERKQTEGWC